MYVSRFTTQVVLQPERYKRAEIPPKNNRPASKPHPLSYFTMCQVHDICMRTDFCCCGIHDAPQKQWPPSPRDICCDSNDVGTRTSLKRSKSHLTQACAVGACSAVHEASMVAHATASQQRCKLQRLHTPRFSYNSTSEAASP